MLTRPDERWNIAGHVDAAAFALDPWLQKPPFSLRNVALDVQANPDRIEIAGNLGIPELDSRDLTVDASGNFAKRVLTIASADIALNDTPAKVHAQGTVTFDGDAPTLDLAAQLAEPAVATARRSRRHAAPPAKARCAARCRTTSRRLRRSTARTFRRRRARRSGVLSKEQLTIAQYDVEALRRHA